MSKEKQIEELTNELIFTNNYGTHNAVAKYLYEKGYRKQSEVVCEIISLIELRMAKNKENRKGVQSEVWQGIYEGREDAYKDIKEIIEQKYGGR